MKAKRICIIHIGLHKTGSSSIQSTLYKNLDDNNYAYVNLDTPNHSRRILSLFMDKPENHGLNRKRALSKEQVIELNQETERMLIENFLSSDKNMIISGEDISLMSDKYLIKFKLFLERYFDTVRVIGYVRSPITYMTSMFQQRVKGGHTIFNLSSFYPNFRIKLEKFDKIFGRNNVYFYLFDKKHLYKKDVVSDFCYHLSIDLDSNSISRTNESITKEALKLLYVYHKFGYGYGEGDNVIKELSKIGNTKITISPLVIHPVLQKYSHDIQWMEERIGIKFNINTGVNNNDILNESDLVKIEKSSLGSLVELIGDERVSEKYSVTNYVEIASLIHTLRVKLIDEYMLENTK